MRETTAAQCPIHPMETQPCPAADPLPVAWATPSLLVTLSAVEKNHLTNPDRRTRGGEFESAAADAERYSVPLYAAPPAQAEPQPDPTPNLGPFSSSLGVAAPDVAARFVEQLCEQNGIVPQYTASGPGTIRCVSWLVARANEDRKALARVLALAAELSAREGLPVAEKLLDGLWHIHKKCGAGLDDKRLMSRIRTKRASELLEGALRAAAYYARGGGKVFAEGMLNVLNKGLQHKFTMGEALEE